MDSKQILTVAKLQPTAGRVAVLDVLSAGECLSAGEISQRLRRLDEQYHIPPATVYRTLSSLCGAGIAKRIPADHGALYMLATTTTVPQLICSRCGKVEEVDSPEMRRYNEDLMRNRGMDGDGALLMVADCRRKQCKD
ncbi:MAG: Fur family transcriptional regulator [Gammaproteobacteria bacterium WSBS_2016_MAG_OTU1]